MKTVPLASNSCHHSRVHGWPTAGLTRLARNSSSLVCFEEAKLQYIHNLQASYIDNERLLDVALTNPYKQKLVCSRIAGEIVTSPCSVTDTRIITMILDYHPNWDLVRLQTLVNAFMHQHVCLCQLLWNGKVKINIAWRNAVPPLSPLLRKIR